MSEFNCQVVRLKIETHSNAEAIEIARVGDYQSIVKKGQFQDGELAVYVPEQAVLPEWLLKELGFWNETKQKGELSGSAGNRVKAIKLRGVLSQGLIVPTTPDDPGFAVVSKPSDDVNVFDLRMTERFEEGQDAAEFLGIVKYEPALPSHMRGKAIGVDYDATHKYDFGNLKKCPDLFTEGEEVVITEKVHGTLMCVGVVPTKSAKEAYHKGRVIVTSKGLGGNGVILDHNDQTNLYAQAAKAHGLLDSALDVLGPIADRDGVPVFVFGEVFGKTPSGAGVQDLTYTDKTLDYRAFDICIGNRGSERYLKWDDFVTGCYHLNVLPVPILYRGPYLKEVVLLHTDGNTTLSDKKQIREGVVVKSAVEDRNPHFGRKIAKSVSDAYLLRKGNVTEFN